jgi:hypothetical protein
MTSKTAAPEDVIKALREKARATGLFSPAGRELKCLINRSFSEAEISALLSWIEAVADTIRKYRLKE